MSSNLKISIGMPVYNGGLTIKAALEALLNQSFKEFELIISDNASTDETHEIKQPQVIVMFFNKIKQKYKDYRTIREFKHHTLRIFRKDSEVKNRKSIVLIEANHMQSAHIAYSYFANLLADKHEAKIVAFAQKNTTRRTRLYNRIKKLIRFDYFGIYLAFGTSEFIEILPSKEQKQQAKAIYKKIKPNIKSKRDIENISINGIEIGTLIYDNYLRLHHVPTIEIDEKSFYEFLLESIETFVFWNDYFDKHDVKSINISHSVYNLAIPMRLAVAKNIYAYQANIKSAFRLSSDNMYALTNFHNYSKIFSTLSEMEQKEGKLKAQKQLEGRLSGQIGVDMEYSTKSAYGKFKTKKVLKQSSKVKVLIATHCFFDSPHAYGKNLFTDFYEWLNFLGKISEKTDYDWYIKTHPDYLDGTMEIVEKFLEKYSKIILLPADTSHNQIISEGISCALTVYGTIGHEYALLGVPVINASNNNPHIAYDFNLHPKTIDEYSEILLNLDKVNVDINKEKIYEYYYMHYIYYSENIFFRDYKKTIKDIGGYKQQFTTKAYDQWLRQFTIEDHELIVENIKKFLNASEYKMKL